MNKKYYCMLFICILVCANLFSQNESDFEFRTGEDGTITITGYKGTAENIIIPERLDGKPVTDIYLYECTVMKSLVIPSLVKEIYLGNKCRNLESVTVAESNNEFKTIDGVLYDKPGKILLFYPYGKKDSSFIIPQGVEAVGDENIRIGGSPYQTVTAICNEYLHTVVFPPSVKLVVSCAFAGSINLTDITVPLSDDIEIMVAAFMGADKVNAETRAEMEKRFGYAIFDTVW